MSEDDDVLLETASIPAYNFRMSTCVRNVPSATDIVLKQNVSFRDKS